MAPNKSPAFQFYARDFLTGTATMSLQEVGAYVKLLAYQWDSGSVPDSPRDRARILSCTAAQEKAVWGVLVKKFVLRGDAYLNERLEEERSKQAEYRRRQSDRGKASAEARTNQRSNAGSTSVQPGPVASRFQPDGNSAYASAFASSVKDEEQQPPRGHSLIPSQAYIEKRKHFCAFVGSKLEVPHGLHAELRDGHGPDAERELQAWYAELNDTAEVEGWRVPRDSGIFKWLKAHYATKFPPTPVAGTARSINDEIDEWARS
jgi:uncharacterized protein YdaU (DUF1376 family)